MESKLVAFVKSLETDPDKLKGFRQNPVDCVKSADLPDSDKVKVLCAVLKDDWTEIKSATGLIIPLVWKQADLQKK